MVWDRGHWIPDGDPKAAYEKGRLKFTLAGEKLQGRWILVRMGGARNRDEHNWLLIKEREEDGSDCGVRRLHTRRTRRGNKREERHDDESNRRGSSGGVAFRSSAEPEHDAGADTARQNEASERRSAGVSDRSRSGVRHDPDVLKVTARQPATLVDGVPEGDEWLYELKYDGYRMLSRINQGAGRRLSRNRREWTAKLPEHAKAVSQLRVRDAWLDREIVAIAAGGTMSFQALQNAFDGAWAGPAHLLRVRSLVSG